MKTEIKDMQVGKTYIDNALGCRWKVIEAISGGYRLQAVTKTGEGPSIDVTPATCIMQFTEFGLPKPPCRMP